MVFESKQINDITIMRMSNAEKRRAGGFSPDAWVTGRQRRHAAVEQGDDELAGQVGSLEERAGPTTIFAGRMELRCQAKKAFMLPDSSQRDLVSFHPIERSTGHTTQQTTTCRARASHKVCWDVCEGIPFCTAGEQSRPATDPDWIRRTNTSRTAEIIH